MRKATIFKQATGEILRWGDFDDGEIPLKSGEAAVDGVFDCYNNYIDTATLKPKGFPPKPSAIHTFNWQSKQWEDPRTLDDLKGEKWRNIKFNREGAEYGGFTWDGSVFDSDAISQQRIAGAIQLAQMNPAFEVVWTLANNTMRTLTAQDMFAVGLALGSHVSTQFTHAQALRAQIEGAATAQEVEAIHW